jgi:hypothetical protein
VRPLYEGSLHLWKVEPENPDTDIAIGWYKWNKECPVLIYHKDGTATIPGKAMWASARRWASHYGNIMGFYYRAGKFKIQQPDDPIAPKRKRRCRECLGYKQFIYTCTGDVRGGRYSWGTCTDPVHAYGDTHTTTMACNWCVDGFLSPREAYKSFTWEPIGHVTHPVHGYVQPRFPALRFDMESRKIIAIEIIREEDEICS